MAMVLSFGSMLFVSGWCFVDDWGVVLSVLGVVVTICVGV